MRCPTCEKDGIPHKVSYVYFSLTKAETETETGVEEQLLNFPKSPEKKFIIRFWDNDDVYHEHDPTSYTTKYMCRKHDILVIGLEPCVIPGCDFGKDGKTVTVKDRVKEDKCV